MVWVAWLATIALVHCLTAGTRLWWIRWPFWIGLFIYFVLIFLAPFGVGPLGPMLSEAARLDERDMGTRGRN